MHKVPYSLVQRSRIMAFVAILLFSYFPGFTISKISATPYGFYGRIARVVKDACDDMKFRTYSINRYRADFEKMLRGSLERFQLEQNAKSKESRKQLESHMWQMTTIYNETMSALLKQRNLMDEIEKLDVHRPRMVDESLEHFRKWYDESLAPVMNTTSLLVANKRYKNDRYSFKAATAYDWLPHVDLTLLNKSLQHSLDIVVKTAYESSMLIEHGVVQAIRELSHLQDDRILKDALQRLKQSQVAVQKTLDKSDFLRERKVFEERLAAFEHSRAVWVEGRLKPLEASVKHLQEKLVLSNSIYSDLVAKKRVSVEYVAMNDATLRKVLSLTDPRDDREACEQRGWRFLHSDGGVDVYRKFLAGAGSRFACVMCRGEVGASPNQVLALLEDGGRIREYNTLHNTARDLEILAPDTKVFWADTPAMFPLKARDFCTVIHVRKLRDGTIVVMNRDISHPRAPQTANYVRGKIVIAANIIQPIAGRPTRCRVTMITQVDPGGFAPPAIMNHLCSKGPPGYMKGLEIAAMKTKKQPRGFAPMPLKPK